jgi:hypothetical protein
MGLLCVRARSPGRHWSGRREQLGEFGAGVGAGVVQSAEVGFLARGLSLGFLPRSRPFVRATFIPSRVLILIRSDSNSATMARTLKQQPADGVGRVVHRPPEAERDVAGGELGDVASIG